MKTAARPARTDAAPPRLCENCGRPAAEAEQLCNECALERSLFHREDRPRLAEAPRASGR